MKKIIVLLVIVTMILGMIPAYAVTGDQPSSWAKELVTDAISKGYVPSHLQSKYQTPITREEFAELFVTAVFAEVNKTTENLPSGYRNALEFTELTVGNFLSKVSTTEVFTDTDNDYIKVANILGMVNGVGNNKFNPDGLITREQAAIMFVNYFQTVYYPGGYDAYETLDDITDASSWAEEAVAWAYGAGFINGTRAFTHANGKVTSLGHFDTKGNFTREQAIVVISRLGSGEGNKEILGNLILRGYLLIGFETLMSGYEIDGDIIFRKSSGYDYKYSAIKEFLRTQTKLKTFAESATTEQIITALSNPNGSGEFMLDAYHMGRVIDGSPTLYDYGVFSIQHNTDGYLSIISKNPGYPYLSYAGGQLSYVKDGVRIVVTGEEIK